MPRSKFVRILYVALQVLETKVIQLPEKKPTRRRLRAKVGAFAKKKISKENAAAKAKPKTLVAKKKKKEAVKPIEETVTASDIRRSGCGRSAVKKVMKRLLEIGQFGFYREATFPIRWVLLLERMSKFVAESI